MRDPVSLCIAELMLTLICQFRGEVDRVGELAEKLVASATKQGLRYAAYALVLHGWALAARGKITIGIEKMQTGLDQLHVGGAGLRRSYLLWLLAETLTRVGDDRAGMALARRSAYFFWNTRNVTTRRRFQLLQASPAVRSPWPTLHPRARGGRR
jgi:hypothetical protein